LPPRGSCARIPQIRYRIRLGLTAGWPSLRHGERTRAEAPGQKLRNATLTSIAPTGTLSIIAGSGGIERYSALAFVSPVRDGQDLPETNTCFEAALRAAGGFRADLKAEVETRGAVRGIPSMPERSQGLYPTARDIAPEWHLAIQQAFQEGRQRGLEDDQSAGHRHARRRASELHVGVAPRAQGGDGLPRGLQGCRGAGPR
jgi:hypothetical protein